MNDLKNKTELELLDLRMKINEEMDSRKNDDKVRAFQVTDGWVLDYTFIYAANAIKFLKETVSDEDFLSSLMNDNDPKLTLRVVFIHPSGVKFCEDHDRAGLIKKE